MVDLPDPTRFDALFKNIFTELHADPFFGQRVGIENSSYFCYNFKRLEGMTPTEFRAMYADG